MGRVRQRTDWSLPGRYVRWYSSSGPRPGPQENDRIKPFRLFLLSFLAAALWPAGSRAEGSVPPGPAALILGKE